MFRRRNGGAFAANFGRTKADVEQNQSGAKKRDANPVDAALHLSPRQTRQPPPGDAENHEYDGQVDPEEIRPRHELDHDAAVKMTQYPSRRVDGSDDAKR